MTIRLCCVSTSRNTDQILSHIAALPGIELVLHLGDGNADFKASAITRLTRRTGRRGHLMQDQHYSGAARALIEDPDFTRSLDEFIDHLYRRAPGNAHKSHQLRTMQDFVDYYHVLADVIADRIQRENITHCLFFNVPHLAYDTIVFQVAQAMGLPCVIATQSLFPGRYFSMTQPSAMGRFVDVPAAPFPIQRGEKPDLFYMKGIKQVREDGAGVSAGGFAQLIAYLALQRPLQALNPVYVLRLYRHIRRIYAAFPKWRDPFAKFFHADNLAYFDHLMGFEGTPVDLSGDFVYVPLQLQPEMTTSALGQGYRDQALAIERLADMLPDGVRILVKENPKQYGHYMRGPLFFHRLARIPSVTFLPSWADTRALTDHARAVATITGTAGWEAICSGKPALVFGAAWYRNLPGVVRYAPGLTWDALLAAAPDHAALEQAAGALLARTHPGVVDRHYTRLVPDFDAEANAVQVAATLAGLLTGTGAFTFPG